MVTWRTTRLAPRVPGVYIPVGTTAYALERRVALTAQKVGIKLDEKDVRAIASHPEALQQFQVQTGMAIFDGRPLPYKEGMKVLQANQEKFAAARANGEYEIAWGAFHRTKWEAGLWVNNDSEYMNTLDIDGKFYLEYKDISDDVYAFYKFNDMSLEGLPRVRAVSETNLEGIVLEIPVNGLSVTPNRSTQIDIPAEKFIVIHYDNGINVIVERQLLVAQEDGQKVAYRVIK